MKIHIITRLVAGLIALTSIIIVIFLSCFSLCQSGYWANVAMGVFGSAFIAYLIATISYGICRKEAILNYLGALYIYRYKLIRLKTALSGKISSEKVDSLVSDLDEFFYKLHYEYYSKTFHIMKKSDSAKTLDSVFTQTIEIAEKIRSSNQVVSDLQVATGDMLQKIDDAISRVEALARKLKLIRPV